ncbi:MAG: hypothetical protein LAP61_15625 [Acidobacteriia bacterium]|nr:hypothetical protein [Terriglobia bacterium]
MWVSRISQRPVPTYRDLAVGACQALLRLWGGSPRGSVKRHVFFAAALAIISGAAIYVGAPYASRYAEDYGQFLDGGWRLLNGQRPHLDFYSPYGVFVYVPITLGLALAHDVRGMGYGNALMALLAGVWAYGVARRRLTSSASIFAALSLALLACAPYPLGQFPNVLSYAMIYNRQSYALLGILLIEAYPAVEDGARRSRAELAGGLSSGAVCGILFFLKPTYFLAAVTLLAAGLFLRPVRRERLLALAAGFSAVALATLWYLRFDVGAVLRDMAMVAGARTGGLFMDSLGQRSVASSFELLMLLICAILTPRKRDAKVSGWRQRFLQNPGLAYAAVLSALGFLLLWTNWQDSGLPLNPLFAIMLASPIAVSRAPGETKEGTERANVRAGLVLILALIVAIPRFASDVLGMAIAVQDTRHTRLTHAALFDAPPVVRLMVPDWYALYLRDGIDLLRRASGSQETVACLDFDNPFGYALQRPPFRGGSPAMQYGYTFSDTHRPTAEWLLGGADVVLVPKRPILPLEPLMRNYSEFLHQRFRLAAESSQWFLYRRVR